MATPTVRNAMIRNAAWKGRRTSKARRLIQTLKAIESHTRNDWATMARRCGKRSLEDREATAEGAQDSRGEGGEPRREHPEHALEERHRLLGARVERDEEQEDDDGSAPRRSPRPP